MDTKKKEKIFCWLNGIGEDKNGPNPCYFYLILMRNADAKTT